MKRIIWLLLIILGLMIVIGGCARWPDGPGPGPDKTDYQLEITVEVKGEINTYEGIYYIVLDADGDSADGPEDDISLWEDNYYYIKFENGLFYFAQVGDGVDSTFNGGSMVSTNKFQVIIALSDLGNPSNIEFLDINVLTTDSDNNTYDSLDNYFTINTDLGSSEDITDSEDDLWEDGGVNYDLVRVTAQITIP
jgi:hypothetical protein